jgi:hypothetical protein
MIDLSNYSCDKCVREFSRHCKHCLHTAEKSPTSFKPKKKTGVQTPEFRKPTPPPPPPTSGSNAVKPPERGLRIKVDPIDDVCNINIVDIIEVFKSQQFICSMCEKIVSPEVKVNQDGMLEMTSETGELRGGLGNKVIKNHICSECMKKISFI